MLFKLTEADQYGLALISWSFCLATVSPENETEMKENYILIFLHHNDFSTSEKQIKYCRICSSFNLSLVKLRSLPQS